MVDDVELVNAIRLVRAQQGKQTILTGGRVNGPGQDDLACEAVCATRAIIWSREGVFATRHKGAFIGASFDNNNSTRGGRCHEGADIAGER